MPKIVREEKDHLNSTISITIERADYQEKFKSELNKYRKEASLKGFRKGKTPTSVLLKMFGKGIIADVVHKTLQDELFKYLEEEDIHYLGQPIPSEDQQPHDLDPKDMDDYEFKFDLGLAPKFELEGVSKLHTFSKYVPEVSDEVIDKELEEAQKRLGDRINPEEDIESNDILTIEAKELEGDTVKENGHNAEFSILVNNIKSEAIKELVLTKKQGDSFHANVFELEGSTEDYVRKYLLKLEGEEEDKEINPEFELTVTEVSRLVPAKQDEEFFSKYFGDEEVRTVEESREKIREEFSNHYNRQGVALLKRDVQERLAELNALELPEEFLKRWLLATNEDAKPEDIEAEYGNFIKYLQWTLLRNKIAKDYELQVEPEDIQEKALEQIRGMMRGYSLPEDMAASFVQRTLSDQKQVEKLAEEVLTDKVFDKILEEINIETETISMEAFDEKIAEAQKAAQQATTTQLSLEEEE